MTRNLAFLIFLVAGIAIGMRYVHRAPEAPSVQKSPIINDITRHAERWALETSWTVDRSTP